MSFYYKNRLIKKFQSNVFCYILLNEIENIILSICMKCMNFFRIYLSVIEVEHSIDQHATELTMV